MLFFYLCIFSPLSIKEKLKVTTVKLQKEKSHKGGPFELQGQTESVGPLLLRLVHNKNDTYKVNYNDNNICVHTNER